MKVLGSILFSILASSSAFADVNCLTIGGWSLQFNSGSQPVFTEVFQILKSGKKSPADVLLQQVYQSPSEFKARVELDNQAVDIRSTLSGKNNEYAIYTGTLSIDGVMQVVTCNQN